MRKILGVITCVLIIMMITIGYAETVLPKHLSLYEKDADGNIVKGGAQGKLIFQGYYHEYSLYNFGANKLQPNTEYALICFGGVNYDDVLLDIFNSTKNGSIKSPTIILPSRLIYEDGDSANGKKLWLVLNDDLIRTDTGYRLVGWNPSEYLFEEYPLP